ncbi:MAG: glycosyltransferase family 2 protein, partial [Pseudomonadota bacterium]|nr:glycosyltransferase family 2 protein [Pseudomonadota bacterium]
MKTLTILIPVYNEAAVIVANLREIIAQARAIPDINVNFLLVDDGSTDGTPALLKTGFAQDDAVHYLRLNHNFGKEAALSAGLNAIRQSDAVIVMDSDLQHPPALLAQMVALWQQGFDVVEACKASRGEESTFSKWGSALFYALFDRLSGVKLRSQSDFKLLDRKVVDFYCALPERERFFRGLIGWMHFNTTQVQFDVPPNTRDGSTWSRWRLIRYALRSITSFTSFPLQIVTLFGVLTFIMSLIIGGIAITDKIAGRAVDGFSTVIVLILAIGSVLMFSLGLIGVY